MKTSIQFRNIIANKYLIFLLITVLQNVPYSKALSVETLPFTAFNDLVVKDHVKDYLSDSFFEEFPFEMRLGIKVDLAAFYLQKD